MSTHQVHVFISHAWSHSEHYETLAGWIFSEKWSVGQASLQFRNFSVPRTDPIHNARTVSALKDAIYSQIMRSHVVVVPTGMYANYSKWIKREIKGAKQYSKPILAVDPWGQERKSSVVRSSADDSVGWRRDPIVKAIWQMHRA